MTSNQTKKAGYRCRACDQPFHADTPTNCPVEAWAAFAQNLRCPNCGSDQISLGLGLTSEENAARIKNGTIRDRALNWSANGETGLSSLAIFRHFLGIEDPAPSHPHDPDDLRRCLLLLEHVPEWKPRMHEIASASPAWARIAPKWEELTRLFSEETSRGKGSAPRTYDLLQSLTYPE